MVINEIKIKTKIDNIHEMSRLHFKSLKGPNMHQIVKINNNISQLQIRQYNNHVKTKLIHKFNKIFFNEVKVLKLI